jgi:acyl-CoA thioesterase YciA
MNIGVNSNLFGGEMLAWLDEAGFIYVQKITNKSRFVTKKFEEVEFKLPVKVGSIVSIYGEEVDRRSKGVSVKLEARCRENIVCSTQVIFVHVDENGLPSAI